MYALDTLTMNLELDTLTFSNKISKAVTHVKSPSIEVTWLLLGYADTCRRSSIMTIDVVGKGSVWRNLLDSFQDDQIQYGYAKLELEDNSKLFLIHWVGKDVEENLKQSCMPHLNEIRNLMPTYDLLVNSMDVQDIQSRVHSYLTRTQTICVEKQLTKSWRNSASIHSPERKGINENSPRRRRANTGYKEETREKKSSFTSFITITECKPKVKVVIIGCSGVGKSSICINYNGRGCSLQNPSASLTLVDIITRDVIVGKHIFTLEIWDTAGQERFKTVTSMYMRYAKVVICVYDITDKESFNQMSNYKHRAEECVDPKTIFYLVGNKADLVHRREVRVADGVKFAIQHGMTFMECSGLTGLNILKLFENMTKHVVFTYPDIFAYPDESSNNTIRVTCNHRDRKRGCQRCNK